MAFETAYSVFFTITSTHIIAARTKTTTCEDFGEEKVSFAASRSDKNFNIDISGTLKSPSERIIPCSVRS